jgi:hypothetical protein
MISKSPDRNTFQRDSFLERQAEEGLTPENDEATREMVQYYKDADAREAAREADPEWQKDNMEYDLRTTDWILSKVRLSETYAQNLYAAMCNNGFIKLDVMPILKNEEWSCSWRYAGGIVAHMRQQGDYIDYYCSGIGASSEGHVGEGCITEEIREDLQRLGWMVAPGGDWEGFEKE